MKKLLLYRVDFLVVFLILLSSPLFFYKLGQSSLVSWDEAWYAEIARNILKSGDIFNLTWSGEPYFDHPASGFWLIALSFRLFGVSEFSARFMPALAGLLSLPVIYFLGKELFGKAVGIASLIALPSSYWFLYRARSGNLDSFLTFFFLLTLLLAIKSAKNKKYLIPFSVGLSFLFLTKTLVPFTMIPSLVIIFWRSKSIQLKNLIIPLIVLILLVGGWGVSQFQHKDFIERYFAIGMPGIGEKFDLIANFNQTRLLLHNGIGKWFWPGVVSCVIGLFLLQKRFLILSLFFVVFLTPFLFSAKGGIWHLIPLYPIMILAFFGLAWVVAGKVTSIVSKNKAIVALPLVALSIYVSYPQIKRAWYEFVDIAKYISDEQILSEEAGKYPQPLFITSSNFRPAAVFYSGKNVPQVILGIRIPELFIMSTNSFLLIASKNDLDDAKLPGGLYEVIKKDRDKILLLKKF